jgi:hypothetical protein
VSRRFPSWTSLSKLTSINVARRIHPDTTFQNPATGSSNRPVITSPRRNSSRYKWWRWDPCMFKLFLSRLVEKTNNYTREYLRGFTEQNFKCSPQIQLSWNPQTRGRGPILTANKFWNQDKIVWNLSFNFLGKSEFTNMLSLFLVNRPRNSLLEIILPTDSCTNLMRPFSQFEFLSVGVLPEANDFILTKKISIKLFYYFHVNLIFFSFWTGYSKYNENFWQPERGGTVKIGSFYNLHSFL